VRAARAGVVVALGLILAGPPAAARPKRAVSAAACLAEAPTPGPGAVDPFRPPDLGAVELNAAGKIPYREGKWEEAREKYRAALAADPEFLSPRLNVACSFVRQERFAEAMAEVSGLLERAYVPWAREILEAADLGALKARPERKELARALAASAARWSEGLPGSVVFVARQRPPLRVPEGEGVFILNPHQEAWAFSPRTRRYRQLTATDGHVVALARAPDGRAIYYATAEKLVRGPKPDDVALRGVAVHELSLVTMAEGRSARLDGDVRRLDVAADLSLEVVGAAAERARWRFDTKGALAPAGFAPRSPPALVTLTANGVAPVPERSFTDGACSFIARERRQKAAGGQGASTVTVGLARGPSSSLVVRQGAGLSGLSIP
jgi:hypothetical protein